MYKSNIENIEKISIDLLKLKPLEDLKGVYEFYKKEMKRFFDNNDQPIEKYFEIVSCPVCEDNKIDKTHQWPQKFGFEQIRFKKYEVNNADEFKEHVDVMDYASAKRFLVFFLYLKDNKGGHTSFPEYDLKVEPKAGRLLMFPPLWTYKHIGHKPIEEPKYIIGSYLHYV